MAPATPAESAAGIDWFGGREVHWTEQHGSGPAVVLIGGCGVPSSLWEDLMRLLPDLEIVRFDRPGMAGTRWPGKLPTLAEEVATLADLIDAARPIGARGGPAIVVGHSMGGPHAEALVRQFPELVAALVLVDSSVEWDPKEPGDGHGWLRLARAARRGMQVPGLRLLGPVADQVMTAFQSRRRTLFSRKNPLKLDVYHNPEAVAMVVAEQAAYDQQIWDLFEVRKQYSMPSVPVLVLTANADGGEEWVIAQARLARLLGGRQVVLADSRHLMMLDRPEVIAEAIRTLG